MAGAPITDRCGGTATPSKAVVNRRHPGVISSDAKHSLAGRRNKTRRRKAPIYGTATKLIGVTIFHLTEKKCYGICTAKANAKTVCGRNEILKERNTERWS